MNKMRGLMLIAVTAGVTAGVGASAQEPLELRPATEFTVRQGLPNFLHRLMDGGTVRIGYLGGSITAQPGWRPKTREWFQNQFPGATVEEINAAIGGTGSDLGVFRLEHDVLRDRPDLLFVEFAVNDGGAPPVRILQAMEGIVRQTWQALPQCDICFVYTLSTPMLETLQQWQFPRSASAMEVIADHYGIPSVHMGLEVARGVAAGEVIFKGKQPETEEQKRALDGKILFSPDGVHPYPDSGHQMYLDAVVRAMAAIRQVGKAGPHSLPPPRREDHWAAATMVPLSRLELSEDWHRLEPETDAMAKRFGSRLPELWKASRPGATIRFRFRGTEAAIYDLMGPDCGQVIVRVDGQDDVVRKRFDAYCTYHRLSKMTVAAGLDKELHEVELEIHPEQPDKAAILAQRNQKIDRPQRFDDTAWYAGAVLLLGDLVE